jgi:peptide/nickel transport system permease protein
LYILVVFFIMSVIIFFLFKLTPADPVRMYTADMQNSMRPADFEKLKEEVRAFLGLDQPLIVQYFKWMGKLFTGDFGMSIVYRQPVLAIVKPAMSNTINLNIITMILVFAISIPAGITSAVRKGSAYDNTIQVITILGYSLPQFITALASMLLFALVLGWFPLTGTYTPGFQGSKAAFFFDKARHMVLPVGVMVFTSLAGLTRYVRATMIEALRMDYIRTARAKGLKEKVVIYEHAFRNSLIPFVTVLVSWFLGMFSGSVMVERIFLWNGMGNLLINSITGFDYAIVLALEMFYVLLALIGNLIIDMAYTIVDPRIRLS